MLAHITIGSPDNAFDAMGGQKTGITGTVLKTDFGILCNFQQQVQIRIGISCQPIAKPELDRAVNRRAERDCWNSS